MIYFVCILGIFCVFCGIFCVFCDKGAACIYSRGSGAAPPTAAADRLYRAHVWSVVRRLQRGSARTTLGTDGMVAGSVTQHVELPDRWQARTRRLARDGDPRDLEPFVCPTQGERLARSPQKLCLTMTFLLADDAYVHAFSL